MKYKWNSTRKTKKKNLFGFILQDITPRNHKNVRNCYFRGYFGGPGNQCGIQWFCHDFVNFWKFQSLLLVKNSVSRGYHQKKTCYIQIIIVPDNTDAKKTRKIFHELCIRFFLMLNRKFFIITSIYGSKLL